MTLAQLLECVSKRQVEGLMHRVDQKMKHKQVGCEDLPSSDWQLLELWAQKNHPEVLLFMRGDKNDTSFFPYDEKEQTGGIRCLLTPELTFTSCI